MLFHPSLLPPLHFFIPPCIVRPESHDADLTRVIFAVKSDMSWRLPLSIQCVIGIILAVGALFLPESPRHLIATGQDEDGLRVIAALHGLDEDDELVLAEFKEIEEVVEADVSSKRVWEK